MVKHAQTLTLRLVSRLLSTLVLLVAANAALAETAAAENTAEAVIQKTTEDLLVLMETGQEYIETDPERFYKEVHDLLDPAVAFAAFARNVMGPHWKRATDAQQERFVETFKWGLLRTYAAALTQFGDGEVVVLPPSKPPRREDRRNVQMEIRTPSGDVYPVLYSMARNKSGEWKLRNLIVGGVNIGLTYRSQFAAAVKDRQYGGDLDKVIDAWATVVAENADSEDADG